MAATATTNTRRIEQLNHHQVHDLTKRGYSMSDFCAEFNCEESEFEAQIRKLWRHEPDANSMISDIRRNDKRQRRHTKRKRHSNGETVEESPQAPEQQPQLSEEDSDKTVENCLSALLRQEEADNTEVIRLEKVVQRRLQRNASFRGKLQQELASLEELKTQVIAKGEKIKNLVDQAEANNVDLIQSQEDLDFARLVLEDTRQQIADAQTPWIGVNMAGEFRPISDIQPTIEIDLDDTGHEAVFAQIMGHQAISDLKGTQIITLARLLMIVSRNDDKKLRFVFDDEELRSAYHAIVTDML